MREPIWQMRSNLISTVAAALLVLSIGCTREDSPRRNHEGEVVTENDVSVPENLSHSALLNSPEFLKRFTARFDRSTLNVELREQSAAERQSLFKIINEAGEIVSKAPKADANRKAILGLFSDVVTSGCGAKLDQCTYASLFKNNREVITLLLALADDSAELKLRYRYLSLAFALVGRVDDPRISLAYIQTASAYEAELRNTSGKESARALEHHLEIFEISFSKFRQNSTTKELDEVYATLEKSFELWNFGRARNVETANREEALFAIVANRFFENPATLKSQIVQLRTASGSALNKFGSLRPAALKAFGIQEQLAENLYTFLFDSIWTDRITPAEADFLWEAYLNTLGSTAAKLEARNVGREALLNYSRVRLLLSANAANAVITEFFNTPGKFVTANAFQKALEESVRGQVIWNDAKKRFETLRGFNDKNFRPASIEDKSNREIGGFFASIDRNVKLISTYPSMLVMTYHLARLDFSLNLQAWRASVSISSGQILDWFFDGVLYPWMPYGDDYRRLSKSEISMVFYYALEMGVLSEGGVNLENLFKMLAEQMVGPLRLETEILSNAYRVAYQTSPSATEFHHTCNVLAQKAGAGATSAASAISNPIEVANLVFYTILGLPEGMGTIRFIHPTFNAGSSFFEGEREITRQTLDENLERIRLELTPKIDRIRMLARLSDDYLKRHGVSDRETTMLGIERKIQPLEAIRQRFYTQVFTLLKQNGLCSEQLVRSELESQRLAINGLISHFREVHAAMKKERLASRPSDDLNKEYGFAGKSQLGEISNHERGLGYNSDMYRVSRLQILLRIKDILENGYTENGKVFSGRRAKNSIALPARVRDFQTGLRETVIRLDWDDDIDEFVANGIQQIFDPRTGFIYWANLNTLTYSIYTKIRAVSTLAKAGTVQTDDGPQRLHPKEVMRMALEMEKWIEIEGTEWMNVLAITGDYTRVPSAGILSFIAWERDSHIWRGSLDFVFKNLRTDKLGSGEAEGGDRETPRYTNRNGPRVEFLDHSRTMRAFGEPALKIPPTAMSALTEFYRDNVDKQMEMIAEFFEEISKLETIKAKSPESFPSWRVFSSRPAPKVPLLSESEIEAFRLDTHELVRQSGYVIPMRIETVLKR